MSAVSRTCEPSGVSLLSLTQNKPAGWVHTLTVESGVLYWQASLLRVCIPTCISPETVTTDEAQTCNNSFKAKILISGSSGLV